MRALKKLIKIGAFLARDLYNASIKLDLELLLQPRILFLLINVQVNYFFILNILIFESEFRYFRLLHRIAAHSFHFCHWSHSCSPSRSLYFDLDLLTFLYMVHFSLC